MQNPRVRVYRHCDASTWSLHLARDTQPPVQNKHQGGQSTRHEIPKHPRMQEEHAGMRHGENP